MAIDKYDTAINKMDDIIEAAIKKSGQRKICVIYSAFPTDKEDNPVDNLNKVAIKGKAIIYAEAEGFYGGKGSRSFKSAVLTNPTWLDLCVEANKMIKTVKDYHHVFLEGVILNRKKTKERKDGVKIYDFSMGS